MGTENKWYTQNITQEHLIKGLFTDMCSELRKPNGWGSTQKQVCKRKGNVIN